jgi:hypothetical protein
LRPSAGQLGVAQLDPALTGEGDTELDEDGIVGDLRGRFVPRPVLAVADPGQYLLVAGGGPGRTSDRPVDNDPQVRKCPILDAVGAQLTAETDGLAAVVVGENGLLQRGEPVRFGYGGAKDGAVIFCRPGVVVVPVRPGRVAEEAAVQFPSVQPFGECQVARVAPGPAARVRAGNCTTRPPRSRSYAWS